MSTATGPDSRPEHDARQPSEEQLQEYLKQLRSAPAEQIVTEMLFTVLNAAQAKLGRRDARLLIDLTAVMVEHVREYVSGDLVKQVEQAVGQLRFGQVAAEGASRSEAEANDLSRTPAPPAAAPQNASSQSAPSKLWVPGR